MLVSEVVTSESIALAATNDASNDIPYLGLQWFPEEKKQGLDLKWIKTHKGLAVSLAPSNFDALPVIRAREGLKTERTQMAFFRESMVIKEEDMQEIDRIKDENDPYLAGALVSIYDDTTTLVRGAEVVPERMRMQLLATANGHPAIGIESDGVVYAYDYDPTGEYASKHYMKITTAADKWSAATAKPLTDLNKAKKELRKMGKQPRFVLMNSNTFNFFLDNTEIKNTILAQNTTANIIMDDDTVMSIIERRTGLIPVLYDKMYIDDNGDEQYFYPDNKVTLLPQGRLGKTWFGTTPEERTAGQVADVDVTIYGKGIAIAVKTEYGPPALTSTTASEITLPSYEDMDSTYVIEVA